jgi:acyl-CoA thioester hydrolase
VHDGVAGMAKTGPTSGGEPYARATTTLVFVDAATNQPRRLTEAERLAWKEFEEPPVTFRR